MKYDKKAWLRIVEAVIAILMIVGFVSYIVTTRVGENNLGDKVYEKQRAILEIVSKNETLRKEILFVTSGSEDDLMLRNAIVPLVPQNWNFSTKICELDQICNLLSNPNDREIYVSEILIGANLTEYSPRKLRFFVWSK